MDSRLNDFIAACNNIAGPDRDAGECVATIAPLMLELVSGGGVVLDDAQKQDDPAHYSRNALHVGGPDELSLFALVWRPGQWTPVHDHGTWGVVGILEGVLEERAYLPTGELIAGDVEIDLVPGGIVLLSPGSVSTFVPNPDHIHMTGVAADRERVVSLHLYGRYMNSYHFYDLETKTRRHIDVSHFESN